jgi:hypothetical protein
VLVRPRTCAAFLALTALAMASACSSGGEPASSASSATNVVDGITIPPPYTPPTARVIAGPSSCPGSFRTTLEANGGRYSMKTDRATHLLICSYRDSHAAARCSAAIVTVNTEPQAFRAFDRWNIETGQNSMWGHDPKLAPVPISRIGIEAEWVPKLQELGAANATTWVSVVLVCSADKPSVVALAKALAKDGLASAD